MLNWCPSNSSFSSQLFPEQKKKSCKENKGWQSKKSLYDDKTTGNFFHPASCSLALAPGPFHPAVLEEWPDLSQLCIFPPEKSTSKNSVSTSNLTNSHMSQNDITDFFKGYIYIHTTSGACLGKQNRF